MTVAGIDVGGERKGFHLVALRGIEVIDRAQVTDPAAVRDWCLERKVLRVGVDAPCGWGRSGQTRRPEADLAAAGLRCFLTPTRTKAASNAFYRWMFNGERLFTSLREAYPLFDGSRTQRRCCFETFPHAIARVLAGTPPPGTEKEAFRRRVLAAAGVDEAALPSLDFVDAALCALAAGHVSRGLFQALGDRRDGFLILPICGQPVSV